MMGTLQRGSDSRAVAPSAHGRQPAALGTGDAASPAMPDKEERGVAAKARRDLKQGKRPSTAAGEFVREEIHHVREGKHGARSPQQAIAIGLSKARRAGVPLKPPRRGTSSARTRKAAKR